MFPFIHCSKLTSLLKKKKVNLWFVMDEILQQIEQYKKKLNQLSPLKPDDQLRLNKKFRLEWNYNSNHIEGNTLTYGETELLLIFGQTKGNHEIREYEEMKGHDVALKLVEDLASDKEAVLTEKFIREINGIILKEPFYKEAVTPDGQSTRRLIKVGDYKSFPNSVRLQNGEIFHYASPQETPALMNDLLDWYKQASDDTSKHPVEVASELHYQFVRIHPFDDGNGRISRMLMNYHLLRNGYPPVIIKSADKKDYLFALHEADTGDLNAFVRFVAEKLLWSYEISIKAAKGESVDEPGDWEKRITLLQKSFDPKKSLKKIKSPQTTQETLLNVVVPLLDFLLNKFESVTSMFFKHNALVKLIPVGSTNKLTDINEFKGFFNSFDETTLNKIDDVEIYFSLENFKHNGNASFSLSYTILIELKDFSYTIDIIPGHQTPTIEEFYHNYISTTTLYRFASYLTDLIILDISNK